MQARTYILGFIVYNVIQVTGKIKKTGNVIKRVSKTAIEVQVPPKPGKRNIFFNN